MPDTSEQERAKFGLTYVEARDQLTEEMEEALLDLHYSNPNLKDSSEKREAWTAQEAEKKGLSEALRLRDRKQEIANWQDTLPEWIEWDTKSRTIHAAKEQEAKQESFNGRGLCKPGVQIEVDGKLYLIGDINQLRGVCDDCTAFEGDAIVTRYRVLIDMEGKGK